MTPACNAIRKHILRIAQVSGHGHVPTCFSVVEILYAVYETMRHDPKHPEWEGRDLFILSKGHASLALYSILAEFGYFKRENVDTLGAFLSAFGCHADRFKIPGIEASTGSLGHGIGLATGMALGLTIRNSDRRVFTLIGDGESNEGSVWEAIMVAENLKLSNLTIVYDNNMSHSRGLQIRNPVAQFKGFGCEVSEVDGHDVEALKQEFARKGSGLKVIVAHTKKGCGCKTLQENHYEWHRKSPNNEEFVSLMEELSETTI